MRMIREVLRLKLDRGLSDREIAKTLALARGTIGEHLHRIRASGWVWPLSAALSDREFDACLVSAAASHFQRLPSGCGLA